jgi:hypothetical protein
VERFRASGDAVQAARATEEHFASQHRVFLLQPRFIRDWAKAGAGAPVRFKTNARGGLRKIVICSVFVAASPVPCRTCPAGLPACV